MNRASYERRMATLGCQGHQATKYTDWSTSEFPGFDGFFLSECKLTLIVGGIQWHKHRFDFHDSQWNEVVCQAVYATLMTDLPFMLAAHDHRRKRPYRWLDDTREVLPHPREPWLCWS